MIVSHATTHAKNGGHAKSGVAWGYRWSYQVMCFLIFLVPSTHLQLTVRSMAWRSYAPRNVFGG